MSTKIFTKINIIFFVGGLLSLVAIVAIAVYSLIFLSSNLLGAFAPDISTTQPTRFNIEAFQKLNL